MLKIFGGGGLGAVETQHLVRFNSTLLLKVPNP
jgi:hypothetical protein